MSASGLQKQASPKSSKAAGEPLCAISFHPSGLSLAAGDDGGRFWVWEFGGDHRKLFRYRLDSPVSAVAYSPDGVFMAVGYREGEARVWHCQQTGTPLGEPVVCLKADRYGVNAVAFPKDSRTVFTGGGEGVLRLWNIDPQGNQLRWEIARHRKAISGIAVHPDGNSVASVSLGGKLSLVHIPSRNERNLDLNCQATAVAFSPDGRFLAASASNGITNLLHLDT